MQTANISNNTGADLDSAFDYYPQDGEDIEQAARSAYRKLVETCNGSPNIPGDVEDEGDRVTLSNCNGELARFRIINRPNGLGWFLRHEPVAED